MNIDKENFKTRSFTKLGMYACTKHVRMHKKYWQRRISVIL